MSLSNLVSFTSWLRYSSTPNLQKVRSIRKLVELLMFDYSNCTITGIPILTLTADWFWFCWIHVYLAKIMSLNVHFYLSDLLFVRSFGPVLLPSVPDIWRLLGGRGSELGPEASRGRLLHGIHWLPRGLCPQPGHAIYPKVGEDH